MWMRPTDKGQKLNSREAVSYMWLNWRLLGMRPTKRFRHLYYVYSLLINIIFGIGLPLSMIIKLFYIDDLEALVQNLYLNLSVTVSGIKLVNVFYHLSEMHKGNTYLEKLDARCNPHKEDRKIILNGIFICNLFYIYMPFYFFIVYGLVFVGFRRHQLAYSAWYPELFDDAEKDYLLAFGYQILANVYLLLQNSNNDMYPPSYLMLSITHVRALIARIQRIGMDPNMSLDENFEELVHCIQDHKDLLEFFECIRPVISTTMFLQFLITAIVLCLSAIYIIAFSADTMQLLLTTIYVLAIISESFPSCLFANTLLDESHYLTTSIYKCNWYNQDQKFRKTMIIFMQRSQRAIQIVAGNLIPVSLQTFLMIIRFSFSMFTILRKVNI